MKYCGATTLLQSNLEEEKIFELANHFQIESDSRFELESNLEASQVSSGCASNSLSYFYGYSNYNRCCTNTNASIIVTQVLYTIITSNHCYNHMMMSSANH